MATFAQGSFIIPEGTTPDMLRAKRERLAALMPRYGQAKYVGEGIGQLFSGIAQGRQNRAMDAYEGDQRKAAADMFNSRGPLSVLGMQPPAGPNQDIADEALAAIGADGLPGSLVQSESGGNWGALNSEGYGGRGQFGTDRLADAARAGVIPAGMTGEAYSRAPKHVQLAVENWHKRDVLNNLGQYVGVDVDGPGPIPPLTEDSLLAVAHLGGQGGARRFIESGGQYNPADSNGTSLADYATRHASGQGSAASARGRTGGADVSYLMQLAANPWLTQEQRAVVTAELQQAQRQADPSYQMGLEMQRLQLDALRNPKREPIKVGDVLLDPDTMEPIYDGRDDNLEYETKQIKMADGSEVMVERRKGTNDPWVPSQIPDGGTSGSGGRIKLTEGQSKLTLFQTLQDETQPVLLSLEEQFDPANLRDPSLASIPIAGNYFTSSKYQMYQTAASAWAEGALRIATGAAATQPEIERNIKTYFAQPGDTPQTVAFKAQMREMYSRAVNGALGKPSNGESLPIPKPHDFADQITGGGADAPPAGVDPEDWKYMTPEQKAMFQ